VRAEQLLRQLTSAGEFVQGWRIRRGWSKAKYDIGVVVGCIEEHRGLSSYGRCGRLLPADSAHLAVRGTDGSTYGCLQSGERERAKAE
jgi:hypothetical protein